MLFRKTALFGKIWCAYRCIPTYYNIIWVLWHGIFPRGDAGCIAILTYHSNRHLEMHRGLNICICVRDGIFKVYLLVNCDFQCFCAAIVNQSVLVCLIVWRQTDKSSHLKGRDPPLHYRVTGGQCVKLDMEVCVLIVSRGVPLRVPLGLSSMYHLSFCIIAVSAFHRKYATR